MTPLITRLTLIACTALAPTAVGGEAAISKPPVAAGVRLQPDQAVATLHVLDLRQRGEEVPESAWRRLEGSEGFRRMLARERGMDQRFGMDRGIDAASFRAWAESPAALEDIGEQRRAMAEWDRVDLQRAVSAALVYLPEGTRIDATVYPLVREQRNSFVWDLETDSPAIFMYVQPGRSAAELEHILAHELHHVGAARCPAAENTDDAGLSLARRWLTAFGEGLAVLAAAGGPDGATHPFAGDEELRQWQARLDHLAADMDAVEGFFTALLDGELAGDEAGRRGMLFINGPDAPQGAFYSVGWWMAATVERELGRDEVVAAVCDPVRLLEAYNRAVARSGAEGVPRWGDELIRRLRAG